VGSMPLRFCPVGRLSWGATVEVALALFLGLPIYSAVSRERIYPTPAPWSRLLHVYGGFR
jgi:energy-converting hydrogenase Eha subunit F